MKSEPAAQPPPVKIENKPARAPNRKLPATRTTPKSFVEDLDILHAHNIAKIRPAHEILQEPDLNNQHDLYHVAY